MKKLFSLIIALILTSNCIVLTANAQENIENGRYILYVSPKGSDKAEGTFDKPLASLFGARDKIRTLKAQGVNPDKGFTVYVREGDYLFNESLVFEKEDSGREGAPITYRAYGDEKVSLVGGARVDGRKFTPIKDKAILDRIVDANARDKIYQVDLGELGIDNIPEPYLNGAYSYPKAHTAAAGITKPDAPQPELFFNGRVMTLSRYPNDGTMKIDRSIKTGWDFDNQANTTYGDNSIFTTTDERIKKWTNAKTGTIIVYGFWKFDWADASLLVKSIDPETLAIETVISHQFPETAGREFYAYNLLEEIDMPGEYYIDRDSKILYFYPPSDIASGEVILSLLETDLISFKGASHITLKGFNITACRSSAVYISSGEYIEIVDCDISYTAKGAVYVYGKNNGVKNCHIYEVNGGVYLYAGNPETLENANCYAVNNEIHDFSRLTKTYTPAVALGGVGNIVAFNEIYSGPHQAIAFSGNNQKIYYNDVHNVVESSDDAAALYGGMCWTTRGQEIKYNYIHDLGGGTGTAGASAIYGDGGQCEMYIAGNVFENIGGTAVKYNGGRDNVSVNNIFVNVKGGALEMQDAIRNADLEKHHYSDLRNKPYVTNEVWQREFPLLQELLALEDPERQKDPVNNVFENNLLYNSKLVKFGDGGEQFIDVNNNIEVTSDPGFYDIQGRNYLLKNDADILTKHPEFKAVPFTRMGLYTDRADARAKDAIIITLDNPKSLVYGKETLLDKDNPKVVAQVVNQRTFVPLRFLGEALGAEVNYNEATGEVTVSNSEVSVVLTPGNPQITKNGVAYEMEEAAFVDGNYRTMLPLREISELFNKKVYWNDIGFISVSDDEKLFDDVSDKEIIYHIFDELNVY